MQRVIVVLVLMISLENHIAHSQDLVPIDMTKIDTSYYVRYSTKLFIGYFQSLQNYVIRIKPDIGLTSSPFHEYSSAGKTVSGIELGYDKLLIAINFRTVRNNVYRRGNNKVFSLAVRRGSNKLQFKGLIQRPKYLYDFNSPEYNHI